jgi:glyoxylase I family protein
LSSRAKASGQLCPVAIVEMGDKTQPTDTQGSMNTDRLPAPLLAPQRIHHVAIIASDYARSRRFYIEVLGLRVVAEHHRAERDSWKLDLALPDGSQIELFSFPHPPARPTRPEACGLRHLCLAVADVAGSAAALAAAGITVEPIRVDEYTGRRFTFFADPDGLPIELYEAP